MGEKSTVLILAGCSGSGKTTLLRRAYANGIPIFGEEDDALFRATNPGRLPELPLFEAALPTRLLQGKHVPQLLQHSNRPDFFVVHLDLANLLMHMMTEPALQAHLPPEARQMHSRTVDQLTDRDKNRLAYASYLRAAFPYADRILVHTLYIAFHRNAQQWNQRAEHLRIEQAQPAPDTIQYMFDPVYPRPDIHRAIHESWFDALDDVKCHKAWVSKGAKGVLEVRELMPNRGAVRNYPFLPVRPTDGGEKL